MGLFHQLFFINTYLFAFFRIHMTCLFVLTVSVPLSYLIWLIILCINCHNHSLHLTKFIHNYCRLDYYTGCHNAEHSLRVILSNYVAIVSTTLFYYRLFTCRHLIFICLAEDHIEIRTANSSRRRTFHSTAWTTDSSTLSFEGDS